MGLDFCDNEWRGVAISSCRTFDFTLSFEAYLLLLLPSALFVPLAAVRLYRLYSKRRLVPTWSKSSKFARFVFLSKAIAGLGLVAAAITSLVLWRDVPNVDSETSMIAALTVSLVAALFSLSISTLEHLRSRRSSLSLSLYLLCSLLSESALIRTYTLTNLSAYPFFVAYCSSYGFRLALLLTNQIDKRPILLQFEPSAVLSPESTAGFFSRLCFAWYFPLLLKGKKKPLNMEDLGEIDLSLESAGLWKNGATTWERMCGKGRPLLRTCLVAFAPALVSPVIPTIVNSLATIAQPLLIGDLVTFISSYSSDDPEPAYIGWALVGAFALVFVIIAIANGLKQFAINRAQAVLRGFLIEMIYRKTLRLHIEAATDIGGGTAGNYMSVDVERIVTQQRVLHDFYSVLVVIAIGLVILYNQVKYAFIAPLVGTLISFLLIPILSRHAGKAQAAWSGCIDQRTKLVASAIRNIKGIKLGAYNDTIARKITALRAEEMKAYKYFAIQIWKTAVATNWSANFLTLCTLTAFGVASLVSDDPAYNLSTSKLFTVIATLQIISEPLLMVGQSYSNIQAGFVSLRRIETLLLKEEKKLLDMEVKEYEKDSSCVKVDKAAFQLSGKKLLRSISMTCLTGTLTMVIGRVAAGKSLLLQALLGEMDISEGRMTSIAGRRVGYCSQDTWLRPAESIKDNIEFLSPPDADLYSKVIRAVALDVDLKVMHKGDNTPASSLSGGQKARVALARLLYAQVDVALLDDVFSALDATTETHVFESLFGPEGLLKGKTVIMVTNGVHRLRTADSVVMMEECTVVEQGTCTELLEREGATFRFIADFIATSTSNDDLSVKKDGSTGNEITYAPSSKSEEDNEEDEELQIKQIGPSTYWFYFGAGGVIAFVVHIGTQLIAVAVLSTIPIYQQAWSKTSDPKGTLGSFLGGYAGIEVAYLIAFSITVYYTVITFQCKVTPIIHKKVLVGVLNAKMIFFDTNSFGKIINRFSQDFFVLDWELPLAVLNTTFAALTIVGSVILITVSVPHIIIVFVFAAVVFNYIRTFYAHTSRMLRRLDMGSKSPLYSLFNESIDPNGLRTIRAFSGEGTLLRLNTSLTNTSQKPYFLLNVARRWLTTNASLISTLINLVLVVLAVTLRKSSSAALVAVALVQATNLTSMLNHLLFSLTDAEILIIAMERLKSFAELSPEQETLPSSSDSSPSSSRLSLKDWPTEGSVSFHKASVRYRPEMPPALKSLTFRITGGESLGVCGRSGSGKSTLLNALFKLLSVDEGGSISIDGVDISTISLQQLRSNMTIIPQDPMMIELSLRENLDLEGHRTDAEIWKALERCQIKEAVERLPEKLDTVIKEGASFSRGESQLLALARALLRNSKIVAFDEATSSIDLKTQSVIQDTLNTAFKDSTIITIAHRIQTVLEHDQIMVLDHGDIVEFGRTGTLLGTENGAFRRLAEASNAH
ncbi:P-loop containing nucleoside triphosphate hydrolase protein [Atractiella rhizophila]|nr:P-loop containing nucleoside triphosphate hydrolase protein [Atractiella rhizophila]